MAGKLAGRIALVTGGASGIGRACSETLAREGAFVAVTDVQEALGAEVVAGIKKAGGKASFHRHDTTSEDDWIAIVRDIEGAHKRLDILVNNAGIAMPMGPVTECTLADWRKQQAVNVEGVFLGVKHSLPAMRRANNGGAIINMSSIAGLKGSANMVGYCATKGAVRLLTKSVAMECANAKDNVRVNSVHPGIIETPIWNSIIQTGGNAPPDLSAIATTIPHGGTGTPQDIANGVLWLASDDSRYVTGAELVIDGGLTVR
jgi:NAD(P)-dependent dehydrogenase (short-subunit alcohol dehydrogenase family)